jgi:hypothetical protein
MKNLLILAAFAITSLSAQAGIGLGATLSECMQAFGQTPRVRGTLNDSHGNVGYDFHSQGYLIQADFFNGTAYRLAYVRDAGFISDELVTAFMCDTSPGAIWSECDLNDGGKIYTTDKVGVYRSSYNGFSSICIYKRDGSPR